jgi:type II secretory pathway pseudopilin PulG
MAGRRIILRSCRPTAFTMVELLFAMAVLSVGMIGVAAAVYTGIGQTVQSVEDTAAAALARQAAAALGQVMTQKNTPETDLAYRPVFNPDAPPDPPPLNQTIAGLQIGTDPRYAWVPLYRRTNGSTCAELILIVLRAQARSQFDAKDLSPAGPDPETYPPTLVPVRGIVTVKDNQVTVNLAKGVERLAPGALLVLQSMSEGEFNGRIVRLSERITDDTWTLTPGQDLADLKTDAVGDAYIIGRGYTDPARPQAGFSGTSQVAAVYHAIVALR